MSASSSPLDVVVDRGVTVIGLGAASASIDEHLLDGGLRDALGAAVRAAHPPRVVIDLSHTKFFGSSFIELLFGLWKETQAKPEGNFAICGLTSYCLEVLRITHLDSLWRLFPDRGSAVTALAGV
ncbi:MAG: STAS domain-containing protein [Planctomycetales bacterium]